MTTFSYNTGVPAANNDPSVDQPEMQINTASINSLLAVDHVSFNTTGGGRHNQVTFAGNNPATLPATPPVIFTNNQDGNGNNLPGGLAQLFYYTGTSAQSQLQYTNSGAGYGSVLLPGGIILKFGLQAGVSPSGLIITFPQAFPNNCFLAVACQEATTGAGVKMSTTVLSVSQIKIFSDIGTGISCNYIAIGN
jgi:hypothetical protein